VHFGLLFPSASLIGLSTACSESSSMEVVHGLRRPNLAFMLASRVVIACSPQLDDVTGYSFGFCRFPDNLVAHGHDAEGCSRNFMGLVYAHRSCSDMHPRLIQLQQHGRQLCVAEEGAQEPFGAQSRNLLRLVKLGHRSFHVAGAYLVHDGWTAVRI